MRLCRTTSNLGKIKKPARSLAQPAGSCVSRKLPYLIDYWHGLTGGAPQAVSWKDALIRVRDVVDAAGRLVATIPLGAANVIDSGLPMPAQPTAFSRLGNAIPLMIGFALLIAAIALGAPGRYRRGT